MVSHNQDFEDRRHHPRVDGNLPVKIRVGEVDAVTETLNLSRSGAYCRTDKYIEPMTKLKIQILLSIKKRGKITTKKVSCGGVIVRTEPIDNNTRYNIAIFFNDISEKDAAALSEYVQARMPEKM